MSYEIKPTSRFQKDVKRCQKRGCDMALLTDVIKRLAAGEQLDAAYRDHPLTGRYRACRECHIEPDWLLVYEIDGGTLILYLMRTGTHSDLFGG